MKFFTASIALLLFSIILFAQSPCLTEGITFSTQAQIDSFQVNYPGCTEIEGDVKIQGENITSLEDLSIITSIGGHFLIGNNNPPYSSNPNLSSLAGLDNLVSVGEGLRISGNEILSDLSGLDNLSSVNHYLFVENNPDLFSISALSNLTTLNGPLGISFNPSLSSLTGLENLTIIPSLSISDNLSLVDMDGLNGLTNILNGLSIIYNNGLIDLAGLENLTVIGEEFILAYNGSLVSLFDLQNLSSISWMILVFGNESLSSLDGLDNVETGSIEDLKIYDNQSLSTCHIQSICNIIAAPDASVEIYENAPGCNSQEEVEQACEEVGLKKNELQAFIVHSNPTDNGSITITLENHNNNLQLSCFNTFGQQVHQQDITDTETLINVSTWQTGIYLAVIYSEGKPVGSAKFVVQ